MKLKQFQLENGLSIHVDDRNADDFDKLKLLVSCSIAVSLKRLADSLEKKDQSTEK